MTQELSRGLSCEERLRSTSTIIKSKKYIKFRIRSISKFLSSSQTIQIINRAPTIVEILSSTHLYCSVLF